MKRTESVSISRWKLGEPVRTDHDEVAGEEPLEIRINGRPVSVTMRTPGDDAELAAGFLLSEGLIRSRKDLESVQPQSPDPCNVIDVHLAPSVAFDLASLTRHVFVASSCGLCGKATIDGVHRHFPPVDAAVRIDPAIVCSLPDRLRSAQTVFDRTGGLHAAAVFDLAGNMIVCREDVGRHNAVDKALGYGLLGGLLPFDRHVLLVSGRASFEIMQKALAGRIPVVAAVSAPSSLAIEFARRSGQTLICFLRGAAMNLYAGSARIRQSE